MNPFDAVVIAVAILAMVLGFRSGLLRSLATILGYLVAVPVAVAVTPRIIPFVGGQGAVAPDNTWAPLFVVMIAVGFLLGALFRIAVGEMVGPDGGGLFDRVAGAALGAVRIFLVAVLIVVIFDRLIPLDRQPQFLIGSRLRPYLSAAGQHGLQSLPPEVDAYIDRIKRERGL
jgi:membrane protein required for colicin V production